MERTMIDPQEMASIMEDAKELIRLLRTGDKWQQAAKRLAVKSFSAGLSIEVGRESNKVTA